MTDTVPHPYMPPHADVADVYAGNETAELKYFSAAGRIGRLRYLAWATGGSLVYGVVAGLLGLIPVLGIIITVVAILALIWFTVVTAIKRCHDVGASGWWSLTSLIPLINLIWVVIPGDKAANRFGPPPPPNTWGVRILAVIFPVIVGAGILAAVAIPQYAQYTAKAKAAQAAQQAQQQAQQPGQ